MGMSHAWASYCDHLVKRPLITKVITGVVGTIVGDGIAQATSHLSARRVARPGARKPRFQYDWARAARLCAYAACLGTPIGHYWFAFLDKAVFPTRMGHPLTAVLKMGLDQAFMAPAGMVLFFLSISLMEGKPLQQAVGVVRDKFVPTMIANYMVVNFRFVPPEQRILYVNAIYIGWVSFLSSMAAADTQSIKVGGGRREAGRQGPDDLAYGVKTE
ncbi:protein Mpv17 [Monoraphidium neglectum]|uniref:Protein Mpv17 n=1 Tax=Monoraphidium neglectum TaxID=145388 RepID=A0A0D2K6X3_9CHLO|nr:protein Mpv17 [Monoraphidium neglectum]KIZ06048.1 protein Mpv17 [Monoraphidium neglectum]|eukprot:XP_013905067.1 protein Mpv17 [Monoraphidium neglectum]